MFLLPFSDDVDSFLSKWPLSARDYLSLGETCPKITRILTMWGLKFLYKIEFLVLNNTSRMIVYLTVHNILYDVFVDLQFCKVLLLLACDSSKFQLFLIS